MGRVVGIDRHSERRVEKQPGIRAEPRPAGVARAKDAEKMDRKMHALRPFDKRCELTVEGGLNRPPMERTKANQRLFQTAQEAARDIGVEVEQSATGGGSDGNFTAALGVPTLDGTGAVGAGAHAAHEHVLTESFPRRVALLAGLLLDC